MGLVAARSESNGGRSSGVFHGRRARARSLDGPRSLAHSAKQRPGRSAVARDHRTHHALSHPSEVRGRLGPPRGSGVLRRGRTLSGARRDASAPRWAGPRAGAPYALRDHRACRSASGLPRGAYGRTSSGGLVELRFRAAGGMARHFPVDALDELEAEPSGSRRQPMSTSACCRASAGEEAVATSSATVEWCGSIATGHTEPVRSSRSTPSPPS